MWQRILRRLLVTLSAIASLGGLAYQELLEPTKGTADAQSAATWFWLAFAALDLVAAAGLLLFSRKFGDDNEHTRRRAQGVMIVVYALIFLVGAGFLYWAFAGAEIHGVPSRSEGAHLPGRGATAHDVEQLEPRRGIVRQRPAICKPLALPGQGRASKCASGRSSTAISPLSPKSSSATAT